MDAALAELQRKEENPEAFLELCRGPGGTGKDLEVLNGFFFGMKS